MEIRKNDSELEQKIESILSKDFHFPGAKVEIYALTLDLNGHTQDINYDTITIKYEPKYIDKIEGDNEFNKALKKRLKEFGIETIYWVVKDEYLKSSINETPDKSKYDEIYDD